MLCILVLVLCQGLIDKGLEQSVEEWKLRRMSHYNYFYPFHLEDTVYVVTF